MLLAGHYIPNFSEPIFTHFLAEFEAQKNSVDAHQRSLPFLKVSLKSETMPFSYKLLKYYRDIRNIPHYWYK